MTNKVFVVGVGMVPFMKPSVARPYTDMGPGAVTLALKDAGLSYGAIQQAYASYVFGDSAAGQAVLYKVGLSGIPIFNLNNYCASGSSAIFLARQAIESGVAECVLAVGFEQMPPGALKSSFTDRPSPVAAFADRMRSIQGYEDGIPRAAQFFGGAGRAYMEEYGIAPETFAMIAVKARRHAARNPNAVFRDEVTLEEVMVSPTVFHPMTRLQCCPPTCGAAAAVLCSDVFARKHGLDMRVVIKAQSMRTDTPVTFESHDMRHVVGYDMTASSARDVYEKSGIGPEDVDVVELHDCFTANELITYEGLGLTPPGTAERFIRDGENTYGGRYVVNPSGGLLSKGHPLGATGLAQCVELVWQLRGGAGARQVEGARTALQHNLGLGGACVVTLYQSA
ncbi:Thiolase [Paraburkholderia piptadeniae]|uniref:propanoyl-CoA C-acyltransferase n=2 Tax=Paraburkholderia TaxID=1822464 RepID=A0A7X1NBZ7_9BURK|nr:MULTISPECIES: lipid-transfer protein [Paraburkholderia]MPW18736.1 lipid-transfer protein [Paraburkholderia franconis]SIT48290.1 Thiolase [Paraburkholderia piptadeniae]